MTGLFLRFTVAQMLVLVAAVSIATAGLAAEPGRTSGAILSFLVLLMPGILLVMCFESDGYARAFCLGALSPALAGAVAYVFSLSSGLPYGQGPQGYDALLDSLSNVAASYRPLLVSLWACMPLVGAFSVGSRFVLHAGRAPTSSQIVAPTPNQQRHCSQSSGRAGKDVQ
jgi:hypothetical protein